LPRKLFCRTEKKPTVRQIVTAQKQHFKTATFLHFHAAGNKSKIDPFRESFGGIHRAKTFHEYLYLNRERATAEFL
jgi:hypothetical protein